MAFTFYFLCCSQNNFFGSRIFLHSTACVTTLIPTESIWDYILSWMKERASVFTIEMKSFLFLQSSQGPGLTAGRKGGYHIGLLIQLSGGASAVQKGGGGGRGVRPATCPSIRALSWCLSLPAPKIRTQVYSSQHCLEKPRDQKVLSNLCLPPQKRCPNE